MLPESVCKDITLKPTESEVIDLSRQYELFSEPGLYTFTFQNDGKELIDQADVEYRGTI